MDGGVLARAAPTCDGARGEFEKWRVFGEIVPFCCTGHFTSEQDL